ncbi:MAG: hypothetical protein WD876_02025 [Candidatus Pacearchaeota archaeon]
MAKKRFQQKKRKQNNIQKYERRIKEEHIWDRIFLLHIKKSITVIIIWALSLIIHESIQKFSGFDEPYLTALAIYIIPLYLLISIIYTLLKHKRIEGK